VLQVFAFRPYATLATYVLMLLLYPLEKTAATHKVVHCQPPAADIAFVPDFPPLRDQEWFYRVGVGR
jgi:hypothetical protein